MSNSLSIYKKVIVEGFFKEKENEIFFHLKKMPDYLFISVFLYSFLISIFGLFIWKKQFLNFIVFIQFPGAKSFSIYINSIKSLYDI